MSGRKFSGKRVFITGMGVISPAGTGRESLNICFEQNKSRIELLTLFKTPHNNPLPVGQVDLSTDDQDIPRTHKLAYLAARQAMSKSGGCPDAVVMGVTTGGLNTSERHLKNKEYDPGLFKYHGTGTVADYIAEKFNCKGPVFTISTACSSGAAAIKLGLELIRSGMAESVLAGGADSLCHLTYYGFNSLQIIDTETSRPLDKNRRGMSVAEGSAMFLLETCDTLPDQEAIEVLGGGLSCDSFHPATPHPEGRGALTAMKKAMADAGVKPGDIDYINLHGTGTIDNDLSEARAVNNLFKNQIPLVSSVKGMLGHSLAGAGAVESVICSMAINQGMVPLNTGYKTPDPGLNLHPVTTETPADIKIVLSNSFGFGGNNACLVLGKPEHEILAVQAEKKAFDLIVAGYSCITGAGSTNKTLDMIFNAQNCAMVLPLSEISKNLNLRAVRRLKRLPRLALSLAVSAHENSGESENPDSVFLGTGWGALSETFDFLTKLYESDDQFTSPTDFIGSVHNAPAGQTALYFKAQGPNITTTGGDYSFEQALFAASLLADNHEKTMLVMGADEFHEKLTPAFDRSYITNPAPADGGAALCLKPSKSSGNPGIKIVPCFFQNSYNNPDIIKSMIQSLGGNKEIKNRFAAVLAGIPLAFRDSGENQLKEFLLCSGFDSCVIDYRKLTGEFASASAVAAVMAVSFIEKGEIPEALCKGTKKSLHKKGVLILGFGDFITAVEVI
ncbi:Putative 3-oxoacyl-[acyl-carrier-protein] synthase, fabF-like [Desulfonema limicola]|uniref:3-oxoacyl-[acyl-carrier-protein] synthase, fabF-like n=1 Tax=Desulfonema limicola TaxID=45656 RepID=A0A975GH22_9BACT|nr:beta-ketoacyl-[acyl-carrier-protein] synthase family protein [Desulfonema limicola]QTA80803.1 Putative 3-oxoacyl-[acyl-carrier-protein] synthase, fabF-like [Desulfonema limicola]